MKKGFTLIELIIVIAITAILAGIILFTVQQYLNKGKDANIAGNMAVLVPAGEAWYNGNSNSYEGFCDPAGNSAIKNTISQMPASADLVTCYTGSGSSNWTNISNHAGICCYVNSAFDAWAACTIKYSDKTEAFCVDSRGLQKTITKNQCENLNSENPLQCPES